jgi:hypothetical protein
MSTPPITSHRFDAAPAGAPPGSCRWCPYPASLHDPAAPPYVPGQHTCIQGPLCAYWFDQAGAGHPEDPGGCIHDSCMAQVHEFCLECFTEAMLETGR